MKNVDIKFIKYNNKHFFNIFIFIVRNAFKREIKKMRKAQNLNLNDEEISQDMKDFSRYREE